MAYHINKNKVVVNFAVNNDKRSGFCEGSIKKEKGINTRKGEDGSELNTQNLRMSG